MARFAATQGPKNSVLTLSLGRVFGLVQWIVGRSQIQVTLCDVSSLSIWSTLLRKDTKEVSRFGTVGFRRMRYLLSEWNTRMTSSMAEALIMNTAVFLPLPAFPVFWDSVMYSRLASNLRRWWWPWTSDLLVFTSRVLELQAWTTRLESMASCMPYKYSTNSAISPACYIFLNDKITFPTSFGTLTW